jgi:hypothetical protein
MLMGTVYGVGFEGRHAHSIEGRHVVGVASNNHRLLVNANGVERLVSIKCVAANRNSQSYHAVLCCVALCGPQVLKKGDVLMEFDGVPIANDGTVPFRARERIFFTAFTTLKPTGSTARVKVRDFFGQDCMEHVMEQNCGVDGVYCNHHTQAHRQHRARQGRGRRQDVGWLKVLGPQLRSASALFVHWLMLGCVLCLLHAGFAAQSTLLFNAP